MSHLACITVSPHPLSSPLPPLPLPSSPLLIPLPPYIHLPSLPTRVPLRKIASKSELNPVEKYSMVLKSLTHKYSKYFQSEQQPVGAGASPEPLTNYLDVSSLKKLNCKTSLIFTDHQRRVQSCVKV